MPKGRLDVITEEAVKRLKEQGISIIKIIRVRRYNGYEKKPMAVGRELKCNGRTVIEIFRKEKRLFYRKPPGANPFYLPKGCWQVLDAFFKEMEIPYEESIKPKRLRCLRDNSLCEPKKKPKGFCNGMGCGG